MLVYVFLFLFASAATAESQSARIEGVVRDDTAAPLAGVSVELRSSSGRSDAATTDAGGRFQFDHLAQGAYQLTFTLINFASVRRELVTPAAGVVRIDVNLHFAVNADVTVTAKRTFTNLADVEHPEENLVGVAQAASQGAIVAKQLEQRPLMRDGEVLETVPGIIVTQHSGEGKANQYFLRGFNLDHGTDLATTVAGLPVNMPTHAHGQGYSDLNFLIPELVSGVQFSKGPYYADQGDFATAGSSNINYATVLDDPIVHVEGGGEGYARVVAAGSSRLGSGHLLAAIEVSHNDGPWDHPDDYQKLNGVVRYSQGNVVNGWALTAMGYHGRWNSTDQVPQRAIADGALDRFGTVDPTDGGHSYRYSASMDWQHGTGRTLTKVTAYGLAYDLDLFSNFTYALQDPLHGDQIEQADHRFVSGGKITHRRLGKWAGHDMQNSVGLQIRNDDIMGVALYHTQARVRLDTASDDAVLETTAGIFGQNELEWTPWLRTLAGVRVDTSRFRVNALDAANSGTATASLVSPKGGVTLGPWKATEFYVNGGTGFHSNDARGTTITRDAEGNRGESSDAARARRRRGSRHPNRCASASAEHGDALDAAPRFGARVLGRRRHDGAEPPERSSRRRVGQLLQSGHLARVRRRPVVVARALHVVRSGWPVCAGGSGNRRVGWCHGGYVPQDVRQPPVAVLWTADARRRQLGAVECDEPPEPPGRLSCREENQDRGRRVQSAERERQRHRLLLHVATTWRAARRH